MEIVANVTKQQKSQTVPWPHLPMHTGEGIGFVDPSEHLLFLVTLYKKKVKMLTTLIDLFITIVCKNLRMGELFRGEKLLKKVNFFSSLHLSFVFTSKE